jgi:hypothetical protein
MNINKKITFILNIGAYSSNSGWARAMHRLALMLHKRGENVYTLGVGPKDFPYKVLTSKDGSPLPDFYWNHKLNQALPHYVHDNVSEEIDLNYAVEISDNGVWATNAKYKIIWFVSSRNDELSDTDFVFRFDNHLTNTKRSFDGNLFVPDMNAHFWTKGYYKRTFNTYYIKKAQHRYSMDKIQTMLQEAVGKFGTNDKLINLDKTGGYLAGDPDHDYNKEVLQNTKYFWTVDTNTFFSLAAAMCGAISIVIPDETPKEKWFLSRMFKYGISYGYDDIDHAINTQTLIPNHLYNLEKESQQEVNKFVEFCYQKF